MYERRLCNIIDVIQHMHLSDLTSQWKESLGEQTQGPDIWMSAISKSNYEIVKMLLFDIDPSPLREF
jgi:hypothetical protein